MKTHIILISVIFVLSVLTLFFIDTAVPQHTHRKTQNNICRGYLTDKEYLQHMIPHHQVAVDISILLQKKTKNPEMQEILRKIIWVQNYEIQLMRAMERCLSENDMSTSEIDMDRNYTITIGDLTKPNKIGLTKTYCDPHFFDQKTYGAYKKHELR